MPFANGAKATPTYFRARSGALGDMADQAIQVEILESAMGWADYVALGSDLLGPIVAAIFGVWILRITKRLEHSQWRNQKLIEKRIDLWDKLGPVVNDIYCYCLRIGSWKGFTPPQIVAKKRESDKLLHTSQPYFSLDFTQKYYSFISACYETYQGHGVDAKLKSELWEHKSVRADWDESWEQNFLEKPFNEDELKAAYAALIAQVRAEINPNE